jgi:hypothetical protein
VVVEQMDQVGKYLGLSMDERGKALGIYLSDPTLMRFRGHCSSQP